MELIAPALSWKRVPSDLPEIPRLEESKAMSGRVGLDCGAAQSLCRGLKVLSVGFRFLTRPMPDPNGRDRTS